MKKLKKVKKIYISGSTCVNPLISWPWAYDWDNPIKKKHEDQFHEKLNVEGWN